MWDLLPGWDKLRHVSGFFFEDQKDKLERQTQKRRIRSRFHSTFVKSRKEHHPRGLLNWSQCLNKTCLTTCSPRIRHLIRTQWVLPPTYGTNPPAVGSLHHWAADSPVLCSQRAIVHHWATVNGLPLTLSGIEMIAQDVFCTCVDVQSGAGPRVLRRPPSSCQDVTPPALQEETDDKDTGGAGPGMREWDLSGVSGVAEKSSLLQTRGK